MYLCIQFNESILFSLNQADMAQLVEQRIRNAWVTSSSLVIGSGKSYKPLHIWRGFFLSHMMQIYKKILLSGYNT